MFILGISFGIDTSACLLQDGKIIAGALEERFNRVKHSRDFPSHAIAFCLDYANITLEEVDYIAFFWNPAIHLENFQIRLSKNYRHHAEYLYILPNYLLPMRNLATEDFEYTSQSFYFRHKKPLKLYYISHHLAHAASAFFPSPFEKSAILTIDGYGEKTATWMGEGTKNKIEAIAEIRFPNSLGAFYATITEYLGFRPNCDEGKVMGLAPYGKPRFLEDFQEILGFSSSPYELDLSYFAFYYPSPHRYSQKFIERFGPARLKTEEISAHYKDMARSAQEALELALLRLAQKVFTKSATKNLCLAGGVALNSVANGRLLQQSPFENLYIQPVAHDGGSAIGAALFLYHQILKQSKRTTMTNDYLGVVYSNQEIARKLEMSGLHGQYCKDIEEQTAKLLAQHKIIGWFQGRMEMGPRSLGNRSILADPRHKDMKTILNARVKFREAFRPYAPSILYEKRQDFFAMEDTEPFMLKVYQVHKEKQSLVPAITHVDGSARVQAVKREENPRYWKLLVEFEKLTGIPLVLNTSFNIMGEPIVCTIEDAIKCYMTTGIDALAIGNYLVKK